MRMAKVQMLSAALLACAAISSARAQWAVVDAPAIVQLIQQVKSMEQEVATARAQLSQAQQALQTMTGNRGMGLLLGGTVRNYQPTNWSQLTGLFQSATGYPTLTSNVQANISANAVLSPQRLTTLSPSAQQLIQNTRQWNAMQQALSHQALANASNRFAAIQSLISVISSATDQKAILELQARINGELGMLQNEQIKLQVLNQSILAQQSSLGQQAREQVIDGHGRFAARFQPVP